MLLFPEVGLRSGKDRPENPGQRVPVERATCKPSPSTGPYPVRHWLRRRTSMRAVSTAMPWVSCARRWTPSAS